MTKHLIGLCLATALLGGCSKPPQPAGDESNRNSKPATPSQVPVQASGKVELSPSPGKAGKNVAVKMTLNDQSGKPIPDAEVKAVFVMAMGNSEMRDQAELKWNGKEYAGTFVPSMAGTWEVKVEAKKNGALLLSMPSTLEAK